MARGTVAVRFTGDLQDLERAVGSAETRLGGFGKAATIGFAAFGGAALGAGAALAKMGEHLEETHKTLEQTISNAGQSYDEFAKQIDKAASHEERFGHSTSDTNDALSILTRATGDTKQSLADMDLVTQIAAVHHSSLADAANVVAKAHAGAFRSLKEFGINVKDSAAAAAGLAKEERLVGTTTDELAKAKQKLADLLEIQHSKTKLTVADQIALRNAQAAVTKATDDHADAVNGLSRMQAEGGKAMDFATAKTMILQKIHGTAEAQADTFGGKIKALKTHLEDMAASIGTQVGPALTVAGPALAGIGGIISAGVIPAVASATVSFASMAAGALAAFASMIAEAAVWAASMVASAAIALAPFLPIIAAVAALAFAGYELYQHWDEIWGFIKGIIGAAKDFIVDHINLILIFALGPLGIAIDILKEHWAAIWNAVCYVAGVAWSILQPIFGFIVHEGIEVVSTYIATLRAVWSAVWSAISAAVSTAWSILQPIFGFIVSSGLDTINNSVNALKTVWDQIWGDFHTAVDAMWKVVKPILDVLKSLLDKIAKAASAVGGAIGGIISGAGNIAGDVGGFIGLASGGIVKARPGGTLVNVGEGGQDEAVVPLGDKGTVLPLGAAGYGQSSGTGGASLIIQGDLVLQGVNSPDDLIQQLTVYLRRNGTTLGMAA